MQNNPLLKFIVKIKDLKTCNENIFDNNGNGFEIRNAVDYIELGDIPVTVRYSDFNKMFKGAVTVIIQYTETPAEITLMTVNKKYSKTLTLAGLPDYTDIGVFRLYINRE